jgi:5-methylcytosine-specific restriction endonuclease McrA
VNRLGDRQCRGIVDGMKCSYCKKEKPEEAFDNGKKTCAKCLAAVKAYQSTPEAKEVRKAYESTHEYKEAKKAYRPTPEAKAAKNARQSTPEYKAYKKSYSSTPEAKAYKRAYNKTPEGKLVQYNANCKRRGSVGSIALPDWLCILEHFDHKCAYCTSTEVLHREHVHPINGINGTIGVSWMYNIISACWKCNQSKRDSEWLTWFRSQPFYCPIREAKIQSHMDSGILHTDRTEFAA